MTGLHPYQFINKWGRPYSDDYLRNIFNRTCQNVIGRKVKLKNATRHSWGMQQISKGIDMWRVSKGLGHSDTKMTEHYVQMVAKETSKLFGRSGQFPDKSKLTGK